MASTYNERLLRTKSLTPYTILIMIDGNNSSNLNSLSFSSASRAQFYFVASLHSMLVALIVVKVVSFIE